MDTVSFLHTDHLYTPRFATDSSGNIVWHWEGEAFGETGDQVFNVFTYNLRFPGQYYDVETDTHYNWMRAYDPETGRYAQSDPIGLNGGLNTFSYANLNSITHYDPRGEFGIIGAGIGAAIDLGFQLAANGGNLRCVNWGSVAVSAGLGAIGGGLANGLSKGAFKVWKPKPRKNLKHSFSGFKKWAKRNNVQAGIAKPGQQVHHTFAQQNQGWLKGLPNKYKNQPWNMNPVSPGLNNWMSRGNTNFRSLVGAPPWAKGVAGGGALAGGGAAVGGGNGCGC